MAVAAEDIRTSYPLPVYNYRVEIDSTAVAFSEVSGLSIGYDVTTFKESQTAGGIAGPKTYYMPAQRKEVTVTLRKGVVRGDSVGTLFQWINAIATNQINKRDIYVRLCDEKGDPVISWKVSNAFPVKLDAPTFDAKSNDVALETLELRADSVTVEEA